MPEVDYEVYENGKIIIDRNKLTVDDLMLSHTVQSGDRKKRMESLRKRESFQSSTVVQKRARSNSFIEGDEEELVRETGAQSLTSKEISDHQKKNCPFCDTEVSSLRALRRHIKEVHTSTEKFKCKFCSFTSKREDGILDHERRKHLEPKMLGRPKKNDKKRRARSPFRKDIYEERHKTTFLMNSQLQDQLSDNTNQLKEFS